jgi:hypothetical protein
MICTCEIGLTMSKGENKTEWRFVESGLEEVSADARSSMLVFNVCCYWMKYLNTTSHVEMCSESMMHMKRAGDICRTGSKFRGTPNPFAKKSGLLTCFEAL